MQQILSWASISVLNVNYGMFELQVPVMCGMNHHNSQRQDLILIM